MSKCAASPVRSSSAIGPSGVAEAELQGGVHVVGGGEAFVEAPQRGVQIGPDQPVDDAPGKIVAHRDRKPHVLEQLFRSGERGGRGVRLPHQLDEIARLALA